jgi:Zn-dependent protease
MAIVAAAGPISNLILASILMFTFGRLTSSNLDFSTPLASSGIEMLKFAIQINVFLAVFNLVPLPPLDGSRILQGLVGKRLADKIDDVAPMMEMLLLLLMFTGFFRILAIPASAVLVILQKLFL